MRPAPVPRDLCKQAVQLCVETDLVIQSSCVSIAVTQSLLIQSRAAIAASLQLFSEIDRVIAAAPALSH